ncbi:MAG: enoyl-CoA hydratase [Sphingopyxis macrogoltabida]|uniref:Enoyl-CoA hydratase n=1 Tax=Sphingopyxis macrogoltabida TaxID=33050 RepID=A0A2W5L089_SPHMC|nr:MAG: enoyl-CoA hydratase [Sphingopyxis macrogoltabida]
MSEGIEFRVEDGIATILLNRPSRMNAFTFGMIDAWAEFLIRCRTDDAVSVIVVTGAGEAFCSGGDIVEMGDRLEQEPIRRKNELFEHVQRIPLALADLDKPVIAALNGVATGAGLDLALMCDIRYASRSARFAETYGRVGLVPGAGGAYFLPRLVGASKALEMFLTGDFVSAEEAERLGMVNAVFDDEGFLDSVYAVARRMARGTPLASRLIKRAIYQSLGTDLRTSLDLVSSHYGIVTATDDHKAAVRRFIGKQA